METEWWAIIGAFPSPIAGGIITTPHDRAAVLDKQTAVGPFWLRPGEQRLVEYLRGEPHSLASVHIFESWPVIVEPDPETAAAHIGVGDRTSIEAATDLNRLCALVSLAWGEPWQLRTAPTSTRRLPPEVPESWSPPHAWGSTDNLAPSPRSLPAWVGPAWRRMDEDQALASALASWHQAVLLTPLFPSYAMVALGGAVECLAGTTQLAPRVKTPAPCAECGVISGATGRFWSVVRRFTDADTLRMMKREWDVYQKRSDTAHGSQLHGGETAYGSVFLMRYEPPGPGFHGSVGIDDEDPRQVFVLRTLSALNRATVRALRWALGDEGAEPPRGGA